MKGEKMKDYINIIKGVRKKDMRSQMAFYDLFFHLTYQSAYAIVGNEDEAEEIMQDTLMKILSKTDLLHEDSNAMQRILRRIATNAAIDVVRKRKDFLIPVQEGLFPDCEEEEEDLNEEAITISDIKESINKLSLVYRSIIILRLFEEMSFAEIAEKLTINASTTRVQYTRGIAKLRTYLKQSMQ